MKLSIIITSLALISSTVTAVALPNEQVEDLVIRDNEIEERMPFNVDCLLKCFFRRKNIDECRKQCSWPQ